MSLLPDIPRLYTALAEWLACILYIIVLPQRFERRVAVPVSLLFLVSMGAFLHLTGDVPLFLWMPCMVAVIFMMFLQFYICADISALDAGYLCARAFVLAEFTASVQWQVHCFLFNGSAEITLWALLVLVLVYALVFGFMYWYEIRRMPKGEAPGVQGSTLFSTVVMALAVFAVSNWSFTQNSENSMSIFYIRTLVDFAGVLILAVQQEQLREATLHSELLAMDGVLRRQYEQYRQSRENIHLLNRRYHDLKVQIAAIRAERDPGKQAAALDRMESGIKMYEAQNKTGNPVLDTVLTTKSLYCQQHGINFTCVADGHLLDAMSTRDICTIVGGALENANESVLTIDDEEKRLIRTAIYAQNGFVMLRFENYVEKDIPLGADGLPANNRHGGYDLKSIRVTAQKYGGSMTIHSEDNWFVLRVLLPLRTLHTNKSGVTQ